ncbi:uncharacterized protein LOC123297384 [Chrysoperla carnea]|uniref:uncharacterized protein LOC123297384 n=1 Tax=Chrysoperla carnea TaxID=189513 RepID=UPI001D092D01|nr:uncharacterized protein LOC123297384 [Chrysoperla carnea]
MELNGLQPIIVALIYLVTIINADIVLLNGNCPFDDLKASSEANVSNFGGQINVLAETFEEKRDRSDTTSFFEVVKPNVIKDTSKCRSRETGECMKFNIFLKATSTVGVYDTYYEEAPNSDSYVEFRTYFLYFDKGQLGVSFMCRDLEEKTYAAELKILSGSTKKYDNKIKRKVKKILNSNNISYLEPYLDTTNFDNPCQ